MIFNSVKEYTEWKDKQKAKSVPKNPVAKKEPVKKEEGDK